MLSAVREELRLLDTGPASLRSFGRVVGSVVLAAAVGVALLRGNGGGFADRLALLAPAFIPPSAPFFLGVTGLVLVLLGSFAPSLLRLPHRAWMALALVLGWFMTRVLLTVVFVLLVTPIALVLRLSGRDPMNRRFDPTRATYWIEREPLEDPRTSLERYW